METEDLLVKIAKILQKLKIPYIVTGGIAVCVWGRPRFTADIDIIVELSAAKIPPLVKNLLLIDKDVYVDETMIRKAFRDKGEFNFIHPQTALKVDFWITKGDAFGRQKIQRGITRKFNRQKIIFISPEDLVLTKLQWYKESQSDRHLEDAKSVLKFSQPDLKYIKKWAAQQSTIEIFRQISKSNKI